MMETAQLGFTRFRRDESTLSLDDIEALANSLLATADLSDDDRHRLRMAISSVRMHRSRRHIFRQPGRYKHYLDEARQDVVDIWTQYNGPLPASPQAP